MGKSAKFSDEELYAAWLAHGRNAAEAARAIGFDPPSFRYHVREKRFEQRYLDESAGGNHLAGRLAILQTFGRLSTAYDRLFAIGMGEVSQVRLDNQGNQVRLAPSYRDQVAALATILRHVPAATVAGILGEPSSTSQRPNLTLVDARQIVQAYPPHVSASETLVGVPALPGPEDETMSQYEEDDDVSPDDTDYEAEAITILAQRMAQ